MDNSSPIGLFDSGLGGLTVLKAVRDALPSEHYVYLGDSARVPYGTKSPSTVVRYSQECAFFLMEKNVKHIVVACNTASSVAIDVLKSEFPCPVTGTIEATAQAAVRATKSGHVGVIGTRTTISSGAFDRALQSLRSELQVVSVPCPLFVPLVEEGLFEGEIVERTIRYYLTALKESEIDTLILGCTHYPMLKGALSKFFGSEVTLVTSADAVAALMVRDYGSNNTTGAGDVSVFVTDDTGGFSQFAAPILGADSAISIAKVSLKDHS